MGKKEQVEMRVINKVFDKKIHKLRIELLGEMEKRDKRLEKVEKNFQTIYQELNFYVAESKAIQFCEQLHMLWKNEHDIEWIDDTEHITMICINDQYGSRARVIRAIISFIDDIYVTNHKLHSQFLHDLAIILGFNASDPKSFAIFRSAYNHESFKNEKIQNV